MTHPDEMASLRAQLEAHLAEKIAINNALNETDSRGCSEVEQIESLQAQLAAVRAENVALRELLRKTITDLEAMAGKARTREETISIEDRIAICTELGRIARPLRAHLADKKPDAPHAGKEGREP